MADSSLEPRSGAGGCLSGLVGFLFVASLCAFAGALAWELHRGLTAQSLWIIGAPVVVAILMGGTLFVLQHSAETAETGLSHSMDRRLSATTLAPRERQGAASLRKRSDTGSFSSTVRRPTESADATNRLGENRVEAELVTTAKSTAPAGTLVFKRALIVGGVVSLFPLVFFGFFLLVVVRADAGAWPFFGAFIFMAMFMFGSFGVVMTLIFHGALQRMTGTLAQQTFEPFARHVGGRLVMPPPSFLGLQLSPPSVWFEHAGLPAVFKIETEGSGKHRRNYTTLEYTLPEPSPSDLRVSPQGVLHELGKWLGMQDLEVGDPTFDQRFIVQASNPLAAQQFLNEPVRQYLIALSEWRRSTPPTLLGSTGFIEMQLRGRSLKIRTLGWLGKAEQLIQFNQLTGQLVSAFTSR